MKLTKLLEGRKNPSQNQQIGILQQLLTIQAQLIESGDILANGFTNGFVAFAELNKIGINPSPKDETTPAALYGYPLDYVIYHLRIAGVEAPEKTNIPYASNFPYLHVLTLKDTSKILFINDSVNHDKIKGIKMTAPTTTESEFISRIRKSKLNPYFHDGDNTFLQFMVAVQREMSENGKDSFGSGLARAYTSWLSKLDVECVFDAGFGMIAEPEPVQIFFTSGTAVKTLKTIVNKANIPSNTKLKYAKHGKNLDLPNTKSSESVAKYVFDNLYLYNEFDENTKQMSEQDLYKVLTKVFNDNDEDRCKLILKRMVESSFRNTVDDRAFDFSEIVKQLKYFAKIFDMYKIAAKMFNEKFSEFYDLQKISDEIAQIKQTLKYYQFLNIKLKSTQYQKLVKNVRNTESMGELEQMLKNVIQFILPHIDAFQRIDLVNRLKLFVGRADADSKQFEFHRFNHILVTNKVSLSLMQTLYRELSDNYKK